VAGIIGELDNAIGYVGVAPGARLWAVRVVGKNGNGAVSNLLCGLDWLTANAATIEVANLSLGAKGSDDGDCGRSKRDPVHVAVWSAISTPRHGPRRTRRGWSSSNGRRPPRQTRW
jgi:subtilisin family serine protease